MAYSDPAKQRRARQLWEARRGFILTALKSALGCEVCGLSDPRALEFHHNDRTTKLFSVGSQRNRPAHELVEELDKTSVLCANHHRIREAQS